MLKSVKTALVLLGLAKGMVPLAAQEIAMYNQSAMAICENSWDIVFDADYLYWIWQQSDVMLGTLSTPTASGAAGFLNGKESRVLQSPGYASGFEVGLGVNFHGMDDWRFKADFTWYENTNQTRIIPGAGQYFAVSPTLIKTPFGLSVGELLSGDLLSIAKLHFSELDTTLQRSFYQGKNLIARYSMGLKTLWIDEDDAANGTDLSFVGQYVGFPVPLAGSFQVSASVKSWSLGPVFGLESQWLLGYGVRIEGNIRASLVYTSYSNINFAVTGQVSDTGSADLSLNQPNHYNTLCPVLETCLGLGWGSYLCNQNLYFNLFAGYDFNVFWTRSILESIRQGSGAPGSLCLQGLNVRAGVEF